MADDDTFDLTDYLSEQEIELINYLRGFTEEGDQAPANWSILIARLPDGRWRVDHQHGTRKLVGEGAVFDDAWIDQCDPALRMPLPLNKGVQVVSPDEVDSALNEWRAKRAEESPKPKPMLRVIRGGKDSN